MKYNIDSIFRALADATRREIFHVLVVASAALPINQISEQFNISRQGVTKHIKILESAGLLHMKSVGRERFCIADPKPLKEMGKWLSFYDQFWDDTLDKLEGYLNT